MRTMEGHSPRCALLLAAMLAFPPAAVGEPADSLRQLAAKLSACVAAGMAPSRSELTIVFALRRDGALSGRPRISYARLVGPRDEQAGFVSDAVHALGNCLPIELTPGLGAAIAGRPLSVHIVSRAKETKT